MPQMSRARGGVEFPNGVSPETLLCVCASRVRGIEINRKYIGGMSLCVLVIYKSGYRPVNSLRRFRAYSWSTCLNGKNLTDILRLEKHYNAHENRSPDGHSRTTDMTAMGRCSELVADGCELKLFGNDKDTRRFDTHPPCRITHIAADIGLPVRAPVLV